MKNTMTRIVRTGGTLAVAALVASAFGAPNLRAQETDGRWLPFSGCWEPVGESAAPDAPAALVCFGGLEGESGVEMISLEDGEVVAREAFRADGTWRDADAEGCSGRELGDFSATPGRVFLQSEHTCEGGVSRTSSGMFAFVSPRQWVDVRVVTTGDESFAWFTRYRLAPTSEAANLDDIAADRGMAVNSARVAASARPTVEDVIEATEYVDGEGVKTWLAERDARISDFDSGSLIRLADAGVPEDVIDMAVAVSYPEKFAVSREREDYGRNYGGFAFYDPFYGPYFGSRFYSPYRYGYGYGYGYGRGFGGPFRGPIVVTVDGDDDDRGGRVISGQGYTRGQSSGATRGRTQPRGSATPSSGRSSGSSIGRSSGSSRGSTGRTAKRRGGGGS